jgi:hypothetical protein
MLALITDTSLLPLHLHLCLLRRLQLPMTRRRAAHSHTRCRWIHKRAAWQLCHCHCSTPAWWPSLHLRASLAALWARDCQVWHKQCVYKHQNPQACGFLTPCGCVATCLYRPTTPCIVPHSHCCCRHCLLPFAAAIRCCCCCCCCHLLLPLLLPPLPVAANTVSPELRPVTAVVVGAALGAGVLYAGYQAKLKRDGAAVIELYNHLVEVRTIMTGCCYLLHL